MNEEALENLVRIRKLHHEAVDANEVQGLVQCPLGWRALFLRRRCFAWAVGPNEFFNGYPQNAGATGALLLRRDGRSDCGKSEPGESAAFLPRLGLVA